MGPIFCEPGSEVSEESEACEFWARIEGEFDGPLLTLPGLRQFAPKENFVKIITTTQINAIADDEIVLR